MPYIIEPPLTERQMFDTGEKLEFSVVLIGRAIRYWKPLIFAVKQLGETSGLGRKVNGQRGKFRLERTDSVGLGNRTVTVYLAHEFQHNEPIMLTGEDVARIDNIEPQTKQKAINKTQCRLQFLTHVRFIIEIKRMKELVANNVRFDIEKIKGTGKYLVTNFDFAFLIQELLHRLSGLSKAYCEGHSLDRYCLTEYVSDVQSESYLVRQNMERYSLRQNLRYRMDGLKGFLRLEGNLEPFLPYLRLGEWLHLGKNPSFGLGKYQLLEIDEQG